MVDVRAQPNPSASTAGMPTGAGDIFASCSRPVSIDAEIVDSETVAEDNSVTVDEDCGGAGDIGDREDQGVGEADVAIVSIKDYFRWPMAS